MNVVFLCDGSTIALACAKSAARRPLRVLAVVVGPQVAEVDADLIHAQFSGKPALIRTARPDLDPQIVAWIADGAIEMLLSCYYEYRIRPALLNAARQGGVNIHPSVLPHNGGFHTSFWGLVEGTPLGASLHWLAEGLDTGGVIAQKRFADDGLMTAAEVRQRQRLLCAELFEENLDAILAGKIHPAPSLAGTYHRRHEIAGATTFREDDVVSLGRLMRLGRATSHGGHGLHIVTANQKRYRLQILVTEDDGIPDER